MSGNDPSVQPASAFPPVLESGRAPSPFPGGARLLLAPRLCSAFGPKPLPAGCSRLPRSTGYGRLQKYRIGSGAATLWGSMAHARAASSATPPPSLLWDGVQKSRC
ncbi:unnamed protein product [Coccothraustes coccothraustes]